MLHSSPGTERYVTSIVFEMVSTNVLFVLHNDDVIMSLMASQITSLTIVYSYSGVDQRKHQSSASLAFVRGIHRGPVNSPHKRPVTRKMFPFDDVIMGNWTAFYQVSIVHHRFFMVCILPGMILTHIETETNGCPLQTTFPK